MSKTPKLVRPSPDERALYSALTEHFVLHARDMLTEYEMTDQDATAFLINAGRYLFVRCALFGLLEHQCCDPKTCDTTRAIFAMLQTLEPDLRAELAYHTH